jgi:hypothetical protein
MIDCCCSKAKYAESLKSQDCSLDEEQRREIQIELEKIANMDAKCLKINTKELAKIYDESILALKNKYLNCRKVSYQEPSEVESLQLRDIQNEFTFVNEVP